MSSSFFRLTSLFLQRHIPFLFSFFLLLLGLFPWRVLFLSHFAVPIVYVSLFFWTIFCLGLLSPFTVFLLGLLADLLTITPLGYYTFLFLIFYWGILLERQFLIGRSFLFLWGAFCAFVCPLIILQWLLASLLSLSWLSFWFFCGQGILLMTFYPFVFVCCAFLYQKYLRD